MQLRVFIVTGTALVVTVGVIAVGGVSLLLALALIGSLGFAGLPGASRRYLLRRLVRVVVSILVAMALVWLLVHNYPDASRLDETGFVPAMERYVGWLGGVALGELGQSSFSESVETGVGRTIPISLQLLAYSQILAIAIAVPGALVGARLRGQRADVGFRFAGLLGLSTPIFVIGPILVFLLSVGELSVFGVEVGARIFPSGRYVPIDQGLRRHFLSMILPSVTLALSTAAVYLVLLRSEMIQQLKLDHVMLARSKGLPPARIVRRHALRPAAPTAVAAIAAQSGVVLGNLIIIERIFLFPGFGDYVIVAIGRRDVLAVAGSIFVTAIILGVVNLFADALLLAIDPRLDER